MLSRLDFRGIAAPVQFVHLGEHLRNLCPERIIQRDTLPSAGLTVIKGALRDRASQHLFQAHCLRTELKPISIIVEKDDSWTLVQRCSLCGELRQTRVLPEDNPVMLLSVAAKPLANPPFPLERIEEMTRLMGGDGELKW